MKTIKSCFAGVIGQSRLVLQLAQAAQAYANGGTLTSPLFEGEAGLGKTLLWNSFLDALNLAYGIRSGMKGKADDCEQSLRYSSPHEFRLMGDEFCTVEKSIQDMRPLFFGVDEISDFKDRKTVQTDKVYQFIKKALDGNNWNKAGEKLVRWDEDTVVKVTKENFAVVAATNFPEKMPDADAMRSRFARMVLEKLTSDELTQILLLMLNAKGITANENTVAVIAHTGRGTARPLEHIVKFLDSYLVASKKRQRVINREEALGAMQALQLFPSGLETHEVYMLEKCMGAGYRTTALALMTGKENSAISKSIAYLQSRDFIGFKGSNIVTAPKGLRYLEALKAEKFVLPSLK